MRPGPGVDLVGDVEALPQADASVGTVLALETFEHVRHFWRGFDEIRRVLRPDGALLIASPFHFHIHDYPRDYWRFTPDALKLLLEAYPSKILGWNGPTTRPANVWCLAFREDRPPITPAQFDRYQTCSSNTPGCRCRGRGGCATASAGCSSAGGRSPRGWTAKIVTANA